jgi:transmembrane sensor
MNSEKPEFDGSRLDQAKREASLWVVKQAYGFSPEEQDAFFDWLAESPEHAELHTNRRSAWRHLDVLADWRPEHSLKPNPDLLDTAGPGKKRSALKIISVLGGLAAIVALAFLGASYFEKASPARLAKGAFAETHERHVLEDGSIVKLNKGAQALISFTEKSRYVILERGEANFNIAKDNKRPFIVVANRVAVQAVGTMFNVLINEGSVDVMVTEGRVMVGEKSAKDPVLKAKAIGQTVQELRAGQRSVIDVRQKNSLPVVEPISKVEIDKQLTWLKLFDFTATPLSEIVLEFNQRNEQKMVIDDPSIEDLAVSASIQSDNIDVFVSVLELTMNIEAEKIDDSTILLRSKSAELK